MIKLIFSLGTILIGLLGGQLLKLWHSQKSLKIGQGIETVVDLTRKLAFFWLNPIVLINSYWIIDFSNVSILVLPFTCILVLALNGIVGLFFSKIFKHDAEEKASMFAGSTFSNLGTIGGLIAFSFFGENAFAIAAMYFVFESLYNYLIAYPVIKSLGERYSLSKGQLKNVFKDVSIVLYVSAVFVGLALNLSSFERPTFMAIYNDVMIPVVSFIFISTISFRMELKKVGHFVKEGLAAIGIKYVLSPIIVATVVFLFGLQNLEHGLVFKVLMIVSLVPTGFNAILVPTIYKANKDIANSIWILTTICLVVIIPLEYFFLV